MNSRSISKILKRVGEHYNLKESEYIGIAGGISSSNYILRAYNKDYILKQFRSKKISHIEKINNITFFLDKNKIPVALPLKTNDEKHYFSYSNKIYGLFPRAKGGVLHQNQFNKENLKSTAFQAYLIHKLGTLCDFKLPNSDSILFSTDTFAKKYEEISQQIAINPFKTDVDTLTIKLIEAKLNILKKILSTDNYKEFLNNKDLVHGDFHNENLLYAANGDVSCVLDFEMVHKGHRLEDIINFVHFACFNTGFEKENIEKAKYFIDTYNELNPFTKDELVIGIHYSLYKIFGSFFLELELYKRRDEYLTSLLERDLKKINYLDKNLNSFVNSLACGK